MEITTRIDAAAGLRSLVISGAVTFDELTAALRTIYQDPAFQPEHNSLWDLRRADVTAIDAAQVRGLTDLVRKRWGSSGRPRAAIVVVREFDFGLARMYELRLDSLGSGEVQVFRCIDDAHEWFGGDQDTPERARE